MTNYENDIMSLLQGDTPKQKYDWLFDQLSKLSSAKAFAKHNLGTMDAKCEHKIEKLYNKNGDYKADYCIKCKGIY